MCGNFQICSVSLSETNKEDSVFVLLAATVKKRLVLYPEFLNCILVLKNTAKNNRVKHANVLNQMIVNYDKKKKSTGGNSPACS